MKNKNLERHLDNIDKKLLNLIQKDFPLTSRPFLEIANTLNIEEQEVINRIKRLKSLNYIRRIGGIFSSKKLGYVSRLLAAKVNDEKFYKVAKKINQYQRVTHNYRRNHKFNLWFTLITKSESKLKQIINEISKIEGIKVLREFPIKRSFKLKVNLDMKSNRKGS